MQITHKSYRFILLVISLIAGDVLAHDFWVEAHPFYTEPGKTVELSLHQGNQYVGDTLPNVVNWYNDFSIYYADKTEEVPGELGRDPAGYFTPTQKGTYAIGYQSVFNNIKIKPDIFNKYLHEEGLDNAIALRKKNNQTTKGAYERFIRHAKVLVQSGQEFDIDNSKREFGYELELIPFTNPYQMHKGEQLTIRLHYNQQADEGTQVSAFSKSHPDEVQKVVSNSDGLVRIKLDRVGPWLVKAVKIIALQDEEQEWQSHWASLTFEVLD
jgi:uncharacterized GH25 family protein